MKKLFRLVKRFVKTILGKDFFIKPEIHCRMQRFGSEYGGWVVFPENLTSDSVVYSFGVGQDTSFDNAIIKQFNLTVHAFDPTPKSIEWVKKQNFSPQFIFHEFGIAGYDGWAQFCAPENPEHVSHSIVRRSSDPESEIKVPVMRLETIMEKLGHAKIEILKMDIEGAEYDVIDDMFQSKIRPAQILIEFHHRFPEIGIKKSKNAIQKIRKMGYRLFSVSETGEEFSFQKVNF